jgi:hypothetical protein
MGSGDPHFMRVEELVRVTKVHMATALEFMGAPDPLRAGHRAAEERGR